GGRLGHDAVVGPASFLSTRHQTGLLEHPEMKREARLRRVEVILEVAHALFPAPQLFEHSQARFIRERMKEPGSPRQVGGGRSRHAANVSTFFVASRPVFDPDGSTGVAVPYCCLLLCHLARARI